jgi:tight adherence protein C
MMDSMIGGGQFVIYAAYILVGVSAFVIARMVFQEQETRAAAENLEALKDRKASDFLVRITRPFFTQYVVPMIRGKPGWDEKRKYYKRKVVAAGLKDELTPDEFISFKFFLIIFFPLVLGFLTALDFLQVSWPIILGSTVAGWYYPDLWVRTRISARQRKILRSMPFIVDLLALSTEAGLDFIGAIGKVVEKASPSPLVEELDQLLKEIKVGASRQEALREMAIRIDMTEVNSFISILISADQMGASIGKILRQQSDQIRVERMIRAEKAGAAASQKVLLPLIFLIVPAVMLMVFGPFLLSFITPGG